MRLIFAGTPIFAAQALKALIEEGHDICMVLTQPDRPAGRGMKLRASAVKELALTHELRVEQPLNFKSPEAQALVANCEADMMIVAAYGLILPQCILDLPRLGCLNIHASLLPRWRGAAPIQRALLAGDTETGITIMQMDAGLDTGAMLLTKVLPITPEMDAFDLHDKLAKLGAKSIVEALQTYAKLIPVAQPTKGATYAQKLTKQEAKINWEESADIIAKKVQAFNPTPVSHTKLDGKVVKIWAARAINKEKNSVVGQIVDITEEGLFVSTGLGILLVTELQIEGGNRLNKKYFLNIFSNVSGRLLV
ncbi:MAG: methionyl-tRNA formyltransferase [Neisseriaceae bacterium]|nr:methionyl-tRNA formyltransferase [Neisseriaceae bacterium]